jgi:hypothetical protein
VSSLAKSDVLGWAKGVMAKKGGPAHTVLDVPQDASLDEVQAAFHAVARAAHPDLHRNTLKPEDLATVTSAYAAVAGAYMEMKSTPNRPQTAPPRPQAPSMRPNLRTGATPSPDVHGVGAPAPGGGSGGGAAGVLANSPANINEHMSTKAATYYRKAESSLKRGDLKGAVLQIKLAIAADPQSTFLRNALAEIDAELRGGGK